MEVCYPDGNPPSLLIYGHFSNGNWKHKMIFQQKTKAKTNYKGDTG